MWSAIPLKYTNKCGREIGPGAGPVPGSRRETRRPGVVVQPRPSSVPATPVLESALSRSAESGLQGSTTRIQSSVITRPRNRRHTGLSSQRSASTCFVHRVRTRGGGWPEGSAGVARTQRGQNQETDRPQAEQSCWGSEKRRGRGTRGASRNGKPRPRHPPSETLGTGAREGGGVGPEQQSRGGHGAEPGGT